MCLPQNVTVPDDDVFDDEDAFEAVVDTEDRAEEEDPDSGAHMQKRMKYEDADAGHPLPKRMKYESH